MPLTFAGKAIVFDGDFRQWPHGMEQMIKVGDPEDAINVFLDEDGHIQNADKPF